MSKNGGILKFYFADSNFTMYVYNYETGILGALQ